MEEKAWFSCIDRGKLFYDLGKYPESLAEFREILAIAPDDPEAAGEAYSHMVAVYYEMGWSRQDIEKWLDDIARATSDPRMAHSISKVMQWARGPGPGL